MGIRIERFTRRIRVIWQVQRIGKHSRYIYTNKTKLTSVEIALAMQPLLNSALKGDNLDKVINER